MNKKIFLIILLWGALWGAKSDLDFGDQLVKEQDFPNAILAYKRALYYSLEPQTSAELKYKLALAFYKNKDFEKSIFFLNDLVENSAYNKKFAQYELASQYFNEEYYDFAALEFKDYYDNYKEDKALYLCGWSYFKDYQYNKASDVFGLFEDKKNSDFYLASGELQKEVLKGNELPQKNVGVAQFCSYILPGSGQIYAENWQDGFVSFFLNGLTISLLSSALQQNRTGEALVWLTLESAWYFGGVYSAANSALKYNDRVRNKHIEDLEFKYNIDKLF